MRVYCHLCSDVWYGFSCMHCGHSTCTLCMHITENGHMFCSECEILCDCKQCKSKEN